MFPVSTFTPDATRIAGALLHSGNWVGIEQHGLFAVAALFPEFHDAPAWRSLAIARLETLLTRLLPSHGITSTVEGSTGLDFPSWAISSTGPSDTAPAGSGLPGLTGSAWEYHACKLDASEGLTDKGFLRVRVTRP